MIPPQELQGHTPQKQLPQYSGEPARADGFGQGPDDGAEPENASASEGASFVVGPRSRYVLPPAPQFSKN